jgi:replicative DNA helicase
LKVEDFYDDANAIIYNSMFDLYKNHRPIDIITVKEKLDDRKLLDKV